MRRAGCALAGKQTSTWGQRDDFAIPWSTPFPGSLARPGVPRQISFQLCPTGLPMLSRGTNLQTRQRDSRSFERRDVEFLLNREILSLTVTRAELHLQLSNPQHLDIHPVLPSMAKHSLPTRYSVWSGGSRLELRVDLLFLFQSLQEAAGGAGGGGPSLVNMRRVAFSSRGDPLRENPAPHTLQDANSHAWGDVLANGLPALELVLGCSQAGAGVSCGSGGVHLSHTPFMALYYR
ncbi:uncharacterized protein si:ch211-170d8.2 isoform X2 [Pleuronectes platessa]|uniref:uncharacterized protein si:ch211-170d8.2 isoform X2 n=1 Tax=Pleuronectes platessa TaxID=8262 RepID=UPI00232A13C3|nr:uncharacterized protein si:ch211-170d8.2 isoform X2 [Pleuronectes platessa]